MGIITFDDIEIRDDLSVSVVNMNMGEGAIGNLDKALTTGSLLIDAKFESGSISDSTGQNVNNANYVRSAEYLPLDSMLGGYVEHYGHYLYVYNYNANKEFVSKRQVWLNTVTYIPQNYRDTTSADVAYIRFTCATTMADAPTVYRLSDAGVELQYQKTYSDSLVSQIHGGYFKLPTTYVPGSLNGASVSTSYTRVTSDFIDVSKLANIKAEPKENYRVIVQFYDANKNYLAHSGWQTAEYVTNVAKYGYIRYTVASVNDAVTIIPPLMSEEMCIVYGAMFAALEQTESIRSNTETIDSFKLRHLHLDEVIRGTISTTSGAFQENVYAVSKDFFDSEDYYTVENNTTDHDLYVFYYADDHGATFTRYQWCRPGQHLTVRRSFGLFFRLQVYKSGGSTFTEESISKISFVKRGESYIPDYWKSQLASRLEDINAHRYLASMNGDTFVFITDTHWLENHKRSNSLIKEIRYQTGINTVLCGGDIIEGTRATNAEALSMLREFYQDFDYDLYGVIGNHDYNGGGDARLTMSQTYGANNKYLENRVNTGGQLYYHIDNESQKIRYYMLDNVTSDDGYHIDATQLQYVMDTADELDSSWHVIVVTHVFFDGYDTSTNQPIESGIAQGVKDVIDGLAQKQCTLACVLVGHCHYSADTTYNGVRIIATQCDAPEPVFIGATMTNGTDTEQCFDVVTIDKTNRKLYLDRIGAGTSREFSY